MVSIVIPAMNEEAGIGRTIDELPLEELTRLGFSTEVVVVDSNSKDTTASIARSKGVRVINEPRKGYGRAYKTGFAEARGDYIATLDGDGTYPAKMIPNILQLLIRGGFDFITTNRFANLGDGAMSVSHRVGNTVLNLTCHLLFRAYFKDSQSGMWIFRKKLLSKIGVESDGMGFSQELKIRAFQNAKCVEMPIFYRRRIGELKLSTLRDGFENLKEMIDLLRRAEADPVLVISDDMVLLNTESNVA